MKKLFVIDASGYIYRSYFAIPHMTNDKGESTNALYGFIRSLQKLIKDFHPEHIVAVFDGPHGGKKREEIYTEYKAHRQETPGDLRYQISWSLHVCELLGIPTLIVPEVEADDTMGSVACWAKNQDAQVYLCTSDKDLCQLVNKEIFILNTFKDNQIIGEAQVEEIHGVKPTQIVDYLAMIGDSSDNVPGLPGFGPKTASQLLKEYGTLEYILNHPDVVSGKKRETILQFKDQALLSKKLVTLHPDVEFPQDTSFFALKEPNVTTLKIFYASMNFNSLIRELEEIMSAKKTPVEEKKVTSFYTLINDVDSFLQFIKTLSQQTKVAFHALGTEECPFKSKLLGLSFSFENHHAYYVPINGNIPSELYLEEFKKLFKNPLIGFIGHNIKNDMQLLWRYGIEVSTLFFDTSLASYLLSSHNRKHELEDLMLEHFGKVKSSIKTLVGKGKSAIEKHTIPLELISPHGCESSDYIYQLEPLLQKELQQRNLIQLLQDIEQPLIPILAKMERRGVFLDLPSLKEMEKEIQGKLKVLEQEIYTLAGEEFNLNSPKQLSEILFNKLGIKSLKKTATGHSTNVDVLEALKKEYPIAGLILEYRVLEKLRSTYVESLPHDVDPVSHRIHCTFNQFVAATGRLSCQDPNLQNIPIRNEYGRKIRSSFRPEKTGWSYLAADYSQIELRILSHLSEDPSLISAFNEGKDIHTATAAAIFHVPLENVTKEMRYQAKAVNFGILYGQQAFGLSQELNISVKDASHFIHAYFNQHPMVKSFLEGVKDSARVSGKAVTYTGRERLIPEIHSKNVHIKAAAERLATNTPIQGTAADLIKMAMIQIDKQLTELHCLGYMVLQIHDELIFEIPDHEIDLLTPIIKETMQGVLKLKVPLIVDINIGKNWEEC